MFQLIHLYLLIVQIVTQSSKLKNMQYLRLDEGEKIFSSESYDLTINNKFSSGMETISTLDLQSLVSQTDPIKIIKLKQFAYNHSCEIGILLQLANKQYQVKSILNINETMSNGLINYQQTNSTFQMELDQDLKCIDFAFISENTIQVLCFKDQIILITLTLKEEINRIILEIPVNQEDQAQLFYYAEKQLSIILIESLEQETMLIFIKDNSLYKLLFLNQLAKSKNLKIIEIVLLRQFLTILTKQLIIQIDLKVERKYIFQSLNTLNQIQIIDNEAWVQTQDQEFLRFSEEMQQFVSVKNVVSNIQQENTILNNENYHYNQSQISIYTTIIKYNYFVTLPNLNGLIVILNEFLTFYQLTSIYQYIDMNEKLEQSEFGFSILLNNNSVIFKQDLEIQIYPNQAQGSFFKIEQQVLTYSPIESGPYGIVQVHQDQLGIVKTFKLKFCFESQYNFIYFLTIIYDQSYWVVQQNYTLYFVVCQESQLIIMQKLDVLEVILKEIQCQFLDSISLKVQIITIDTNPLYQINIQTSNTSQIEYSITIEKAQQYLSNGHEDCEIIRTEIYQNLQQSFSQFHIHFNNDTVYIYHNSFPFNDYKFEDSIILEILTMMLNHIVIVLQDQFNETKLINYQLKDGKLIKLKEIPTFGYAFKSVFDIQKYSHLIILLLENNDSNQYLAIYKLDFPIIDSQIGLIEYNPKNYYLFQKDRYLQLNFKTKSFQVNDYYKETYLIEHQKQQQFLKIFTIQFRIRNQLIDKLITKNITIYDYETKLVALQDTFQIQHQAETILPIQKLFYGFISNITCMNCKINFPFKFEQKYKIPLLIDQNVKSKQIILSKNYIIGIFQKEKYSLFNKEFNHIGEFNQGTFELLGLTICEDCFLFFNQIMVNLYFEVKQIIDHDFQTLFSQTIQFDSKPKLVRGLQDCFIIIYIGEFSNGSYQYDLYQFVVNENQEIELQIHSSQLNLKRFFNPKFQELDQFILLIQKITPTEFQLLLLDKITFTQSNYLLILKYSIFQTMNCYRLTQSNDFITITCHFSNKENSKIFIYDFQLNQP